MDFQGPIPLIYVILNKSVQSCQFQQLYVTTYGDSQVPQYIPPHRNNSRPRLQKCLCLDWGRSRSRRRNKGLLEKGTNELMTMRRASRCIKCVLEFLELMLRSVAKCRPSSCSLFSCDNAQAMPSPSLGHRACCDGSCRTCNHHLHTAVLKTKRGKRRKTAGA